MNSINERLRVVDIAPSKTPKTLRDRYIKDLSLIRLRAGPDQERVHCLRQRYIANILLMLRKLDFSKIKRTEDLTTHRILQRDRPCLSLAVHSSSYDSRVITTEILIPVWVLIFQGTADRSRLYLFLEHHEQGQPWMTLSKSG